MAAKKISVKCPQCEEKFNYYDSDYRPFCSEKCKMIDLGHWLTEGYSIASKSPLNEEDIDAIEKHLSDPDKKSHA